MDKIFILKNSKFITGPLTLEQVKDCGLKSTDKIWYEGLTDWQPASILQGSGIQLLPHNIPAEAKPSPILFWKKRGSHKR